MKPVLVARGEVHVDEVDVDLEGLSGVQGLGRGRRLAVRRRGVGCGSVLGVEVCRRQKGQRKQQGCKTTQKHEPHIAIRRPFVAFRRHENGRPARRAKRHNRAGLVERLKKLERSPAAPKRPG